MRKSKQDVQEDFGDATFFVGEFDYDDEFGSERIDLREASQRRKPARQRVELRNEQKSLREQLSDWDDYSDFDTDL